MRETIKFLTPPPVLLRECKRELNEGTVTVYIRVYTTRETLIGETIIFLNSPLCMARSKSLRALSLRFARQFVTPCGCITPIGYTILCLFCSQPHRPVPQLENVHKCTRVFKRV